MKRSRLKSADKSCSGEDYERCRHDIKFYRSGGFSMLGKIMFQDGNLGKGEDRLNLHRERTIEPVPSLSAQGSENAKHRSQRVAFVNPWLRAQRNSMKRRLLPGLWTTSRRPNACCWSSGGGLRRLQSSWCGALLLVAVASNRQPAHQSPVKKMQMHSK